jgi:microcystin-dependent protein
MIYLRDNNGVFEASLDGITWEAVALGTGGGGGVSDHTLLTNIGVNSHAQLDSHVANTALHAGTTDHTALSNIGTNTHAQIDSHIADTGIHGGGGVSDHTLLTNIGVNAHDAIDTHLANTVIHSPIIGEIRAIGHLTVPNNGWVLADGRTINRSSPYGLLLEALGFPYGAGDGKYTCNVPNLNDNFIRGYGYNNLGQTGGAASVAITEAQLATHDHDLTIDVSDTAGSANTLVRGGTKTGELALSTGTTGSSENSIPTLPPFVVCAYIIYVETT